VEWGFFIALTPGIEPGFIHALSGYDPARFSIPPTMAVGCGPGSTRIAMQARLIQLVVTPTDKGFHRSASAYAHLEHPTTDPV